MTIMNFIFNENRNNDTCILFSLINTFIVRQLEKKFDNFSRLEQLEYYLRI